MFSGMDEIFGETSSEFVREKGSLACPGVLRQSSRLVPLSFPLPPSYWEYISKGWAIGA